MAKETVSVEVSKEFAEVCDAVGSMAVSVIQGMKDGKFDVAVDGAALMVVLVAKLGPALEGISGVPAEFSEDPAAFVAAADIKLVGPVLGAFLKKA